jgi:zinc protease
LKEIVFKPKFSQEEFERAIAEQKESLKNRPTQASTLANDIFRRAMLPTGAMGLPEPGTEKSLENITLEDVKAFYKKWFTPDQAQITIVGNLTAADLKTKLGFFNEWAKGGTTEPAKISFNKGNGKTIYFVDKPGAAQSEIRIGWPSLYYDATGPYYAATIMNYALGGAFNSRINLNLREKNGWTYGARAGFVSSEYENLYAGSAGVKLEATDSAVSEFIREITEFKNGGVKDDELVFTKSSVGQSEALKYETPGQKSRFLKLIMDNGYDKDLSAKRNKTVEKMTKAEIDEIAKNLLNLDAMTIVVVGDKEKLMDKMKRLGYEVVELPSDVESVPGKLK